MANMISKAEFNSFIHGLDYQIILNNQGIILELALAKTLLISILK